jgi:hypothetical protein
VDEVKGGREDSTGTEVGGRVGTVTGVDVIGEVSEAVEGMSGDDVTAVDAGTVGLTGRHDPLLPVEVEGAGPVERPLDAVTAVGIGPTDELPLPPVPPLLPPVLP